LNLGTPERPRADWFDSDRPLSRCEDRNLQGVLHSFYPEYRRYRDGLRIRIRGRRISKKERDIVGAAAEQWRGRGRGWIRFDDQRRGGENRLPSYLSAKQGVWIVEQSLRDGAVEHERRQVLRNASRFLVCGGLTGKRDLRAVLITVGVMSTGAMFGGPALVTAIPCATMVVP
jgi:hypothetical protein